jgi:type I restriction enzyme S subunit
LLERQPHLFQHDIKKFELIIPPLEEQSIILDEIENRISMFIHMETSLITNIELCKRLRSSILKNAFRGKLVPQDPEDEPADRSLQSTILQKENSRLPRKISGKKENKPISKGK